MPIKPRRLLFFADRSAEKPSDSNSNLPREYQDLIKQQESLQAQKRAAKDKITSESSTKRQEIQSPDGSFKPQDLRSALKGGKVEKAVKEEEKQKEAERTKRLAEIRKQIAETQRKIDSTIREIQKRLPNSIKRTEQKIAELSKMAPAEALISLAVGYGVKEGTSVRDAINLNRNKLSAYNELWTKYNPDSNFAQRVQDMLKDASSLTPAQLAEQNKALLETWAGIRNDNSKSGPTTDVSRGTNLTSPER